MNTVETLDNKTEAVAKGPDAPVKNQDEDFVRQLSQIYKKLKFAKNLKKAMKDVEGEMLALLKCKLFTIYQSVDNGKEIVATYKGGIGSDEGNDIVIKVPFTPTSLAGYVALAQRAILVELHCSTGLCCPAWAHKATQCP